MWSVNGHPEGWTVVEVGVRVLVRRVSVQESALEALPGASPCLPNHNSRLSRIGERGKHVYPIVQTYCCLPCRQQLPLHALPRTVHGEDRKM